MYWGVGGEGDAGPWEVGTLIALRAAGVGVAVWPGWGSRRPERAKHWKWRAGAGAACGPLTWTRPLCRGPAFLLMWRAFSTISFYPSGWRGRRSFRAGGHFSAPSITHTWPQPSQKCWLLLPAGVVAPACAGQERHLAACVAMPVPQCPQPPYAQRRARWAGLCASASSASWAQVSLCFPVGALPAPDCFQCDECPGTVAAVFGGEMYV